jgi:hypothetical protein
MIAPRHAQPEPPDAPEPNDAPSPTPTPAPQAPPIEEERGPQYPIKEPGGNPPERVV